MPDHASKNTDNLVAVHTDPKVHTFVKEDGHWYIDLPEYLEQGGFKTELEMTAGTKALLDTVARGKNRVTVTMNTESFERADLLELIELGGAPKGGGYYLMHTCRGKAINKKMWLCDVLLFVFGDIPERIYVRKESPSAA